MYVTAFLLVLYFYWTVLLGTSNRKYHGTQETMKNSEGKKAIGFYFAYNAGFEDNTFLFGGLKFLTSPTTAEAKTVSFLFLEIHKVCV